MGIRAVHGNRPDTSAITNAWLRRECLLGRMPAEVLTMEDRERVVRVLWRRRWTDVEIATHTRMTTYTTARIRSRLLLAPNRPAARAG